MSGTKMMRLIATVLLLFCAFGLHAEDTVVFEGYPISRVSSNEETTGNHPVFN